MNGLFFPKTNPILWINLSGFEWQSCHIQQLSLFSDIDDCYPDPCQNNSTCVDGVNDYTCNCTAGYYGKNCSQSKLDHFPSSSTYYRRTQLLCRENTSLTCLYLNTKWSKTILKYIFLHENKNLYFTSITPILSDKLAMFNNYFYFQISMIVTLILAKTMQLVSMA